MREVECCHGEIPGRARKTDKRDSQVWVRGRRHSVKRRKKLDGVTTESFGELIASIFRSKLSN
jgi:hypothetical protein